MPHSATLRSVRNAKGRKVKEASAFRTDLLSAKGYVSATKLSNLPQSTKSADKGNYKQNILPPEIRFAVSGGKQNS
jgi:hypothetical protein